jgi:hypothetical protein
VPDKELTSEQIAKRRDEAIRRALSTPPTPTKALIGKTERAKQQRETKSLRSAQAKPKDGEGA